LGLDKEMGGGGGLLFCFVIPILTLEGKREAFFMLFCIKLDLRVDFQYLKKYSLMLFLADFFP
jgi:hypothetical protein